MDSLGTKLLEQGEEHRSLVLHGVRERRRAGGRAKTGQIGSQQASTVGERALPRPREALFGAREPVDEKDRLGPDPGAAHGHIEIDVVDTKGESLDSVGHAHGQDLPQVQLPL